MLLYHGDAFGFKVLIILLIVPSEGWMVILMDFSLHVTTAILVCDLHYFR